MDWDSAQVPVLVDMVWDGTPRKLMLWANRNGFFYVLDRTNGKFVRGAPFVKQNWAAGLDENGRPIRLINTKAIGRRRADVSERAGRDELVFALVESADGPVLRRRLEERLRDSRRRSRWSSSRAADTPAGSPSTDCRHPPSAHQHLDGRSGARRDPRARPANRPEKWAFKMHDVTDAGILTTASDRAVLRQPRRLFMALDARDGARAVEAMTSGQISSAPISYSVDGKQYVAISAYHSVFAFGLRSQ